MKFLQPLNRVELHIHLDGSLRMSTIWEISKAKVFTIFTIPLLKMIFSRICHFRAMVPWKHLLPM